MGFDLSENPLNNVYEVFQDGQKMKSDPHRFCHRSDWAQGMKTVIRSFSIPSSSGLNPMNYL